MDLFCFVVVFSFTPCHSTGFVQVMEFIISISRSGKSWNISEGQGKS